MAIYARCCDLATREIRWAPRKPGTDAPYTNITPPSGISAVVISAQYAAAHAGDVKPSRFDWASF